MLSRINTDGSRSIAAMAETSQTSPTVVTEVADQLQSRGLVRLDHQTATITDRGRSTAQRVVAAEHAYLRTLIDDWPGTEEPDVDQLISEIVERLARDDRPFAHSRG